MSFESFHPSVKQWFDTSFDGATEVQVESWKHISDQAHTLIAAPTGSGKTLASFLAVIDNLIKKGVEGQLEDKTYVVYVSPLKALSNDIQKNLQYPLNCIQQELKKEGVEVSLTAKVRSGDTTQYERQQMIKNPPHILVTTPESLFLLLTSVKGREMLKSVETLILDEIHAVVEDKRGSHLSFSIERLEHLTHTKLQRIGISATQNPIAETAKFLVGVSNYKEDGTANCEIVDVGHKRDLDLQIELPDSLLTAVMANDSWTEIYDRLVELIVSHKTTLIFVNTRRLAERLAHDLSLRIGEEHITAHHGSLSKEQRLDAENRLKSGQLKALVATASLELGIDIGYIDLVCQISSPRKISAFLQRVGRAGHQVGGVPKGRIFPLTRDDLVECTALLDAVRRSELDRLVIPEKPIDILSQQLIASIACDEWNEEELYQLSKSAYSFQGLDRKSFDDVLEMLTVGFTNRRGFKRAYLHRDIVNGKVRARKGARLSVLTSGGAIPDLFDYDVILEPSGMYVGSINEDFAIESTPGDIFQLGNSSWRMLKVEEGKVRVEDASGLPPTLPFWLGEAPGRTNELSFAVSRLRETIDDLIDEASGVVVNGEGELATSLPQTGREVDYYTIKQLPHAWLVNEVGITDEASEQLVSYLLNAKLALGKLPSFNTLVLERFFDEAGDMHLILHSPFGSDMNTAWGLALRKRFCRGFNFELQAAATEDAIILSLSQTHSFPLEDIYNYLKAKTVRNITTQAMLDNPIFEIRWRWNATRAMAVLRNRAGKRVPAQFQRMESEDLIALSFPDQIACLENIVGDREIPDHPLVKQTIHDCLTEAMDVDLLEGVLQRKENGDIKLLVADLREPSPLAQEIINARPYAFLDEAPAEERRTRAIKNRRWLDPSEAQELGRLDSQAIKMVREEAWPRVDSVDELHDAFLILGYITETEIKEGNGEFDWGVFLPGLLEQKRVVQTAVNKEKVWVAIERVPQFRALFPKTAIEVELPESLTHKEWTREDASIEVLRGRMECHGPIVVDDLVLKLGWEKMLVLQTLYALENQGFIFQGSYTGNSDEIEWCERKLLHRIHRFTLQTLRKEIKPISAQDYMRFLFRWHRLSEVEDQPEGPMALVGVLEQLEGFEVAAGAWEMEVLAPRMKDYDPSWMDIMSLSGQVMWGRLKAFSSASSGRISPIKTSPMLLIKRENVGVWKAMASKNGEEKELTNEARKVKQCLEEKGAQFFSDIVKHTALLKVKVEGALSELAAHGEVTSDSFTGLRALLTPVNNRPRDTGGRSRKKAAIYGMEHAGRWSLLVSERVDLEADIQKEYTEQLIHTYLKRYGVIFWKLMKREPYAPKWRDLVRVLRRMEAKGELRGGYFISGMSGEQYALPDFIPQLRAIRKQEKTGEEVTISAVDPLNLTGIITPGKHVSNYPGNRIMYKDGEVVAIKEGEEVSYLFEVDSQEEWRMKNAIIRKSNPKALKAYLGKGFR